MSNSTKLTFFYCDTPLGFLEKTENGYSYTSYIENEQMLKDKQFLFDFEYDLWYSSNRNSRELFTDIENFLEDFSRADIQERAEINPQDSVWEKLIKFASLNIFPSGFYLQQTKNIEEERNYHLKHCEYNSDHSRKNNEKW